MLMEKAAKKTLNPFSARFLIKNDQSSHSPQKWGEEIQGAEKILGLPQPANSRLMKKLNELGLIATREVPRGKGRPGKEAKLSRSFREILAEELKRKRKEIEELKAKLEELEKIVS